MDDTEFDIRSELHDLLEEEFAEAKGRVELLRERAEDETMDARLRHRLETADKLLDLAGEQLGWGAQGDLGSTQLKPES